MRSEARRPSAALAAQGLSAAVLVVTVLGLGCSPAPPSGPGGERDDATTAPGPTITLPNPRLADLAPEVAAQLEATRARTVAAIDASTTDAATRADACGQLGMAYHAYGLTEAAEDVYAVAAGEAPDEPRWHYYLALLRRARGATDVAIEGLHRVLAAAPSYLPAIATLAEIELESGAVTAAEQRLRQALTAQPRSAALHYLLARALTARGDHAGAATSLEAALLLEPWATAIHTELALAYRRSDRQELAERSLALRGPRRPALADPWMRDVLAIASGLQVHLLRGSQAMRAGNLEAAIAEFRAAVRADPRDATARLNLGAALAQARQLEDARAELTQAIELDLDPVSRSKVYFNLGMLALAGGDRNVASEALREALRWDPGNAAARQQLDRLAIAP